MNSFDLFDTLVAAPDPAIAAGEQSRHFRIAENLAKVQTGDQIISDFHTPAKAEKIIRGILQLDNPFHVSEEDKHTGRAWTLFNPEHHTGDNPHTDIASAKAAGIPATLTTLAKQTEAEAYLTKIGMPFLANLIREARLTSWHPTLRPFQLLQTQVNFPLLFIASILLHRLAQHHTDVLMSSRDCFLWSQLQDRIRVLAGGQYRVHYFWTSRIARLKASPAYLKYINALMGAKPLVVDLAGYGRTLPALLDKTEHPEAPIYLLAKYQDPERRTSRVQSFAPGNSWIERANLAQHPMVVDVDDKGEPIYSNPANIQWDSIPEIQASHESFLHILSLMQHYDFTSDLQAREATLRSALDFFLQQLSSNTHRKALTFQDDRLLLAEEEPILRELELLTKAPAPVATALTLVTRLHCEMPYFGMLAQSDGLTPQILARLCSNDSARVGSNSERMARDFEVITGKPCFYLPSIYPMPSMTVRQNNSGVDNVACFGRVFCLKNINVQAIAALRFAKARGHRLRFHINDFTQDAEGKAIVASLKMLFERQPNAELVLHRWYPRDAFLRVLNNMTIGLQVSLTEASNVISLDMVAAGLPVVVSPEIKWATAQSTCYPTNSEEISKAMLHAMAHPELIEEHRQNIQAHNDSCFTQWQKFIGTNARVLFLVHMGINTGISTVATNDCAMLKANGVQAEIERTTFAPDAVSKAIQRYRPTHVVSEASWKPQETR